MCLPFLHGRESLWRMSMRITFQNQQIQEPLNKAEHTSSRTTTAPAKTDIGVRLFGEGNTLPWSMEGMDKGKSLIEIQQNAGNMDVSVNQDYMTLMSHTLSDEDYAKAREEGFDFSTADAEEVVTIVDKIKAELVKAGVNVTGYTDDLSVEQLSQALGSQVLAQAVQESFQTGDVPLAVQNFSDIQVARDMARQLESLSEGDLVYLTEHQLSPEIWNIYLAQNSGTAQNPGTAPKFYTREIPGYLGMNGSGRGADAVAELDGQLVRHLEQLGVETNEENLKQSQWLLQKGLPVTAENLELLKTYEKVALPVTEEHFAQSVAAAITLGKAPIHSDLSQRENLYQKANRVLDYYQNMENSVTVAGDVTARRQLEEVRLRMTAEVNVKLIRSGFAIDTAPMEELVEALRRAEQQVAQSLFPQAAEPVESYHMYCQTNQAVAEIPTMPVAVLQLFMQEEEGVTLGALHTEGNLLKQTMEKASASYETLMTAPRRDLGDSMAKAFTGVDILLEDLQLEVNEANRKAVRALGYNQMPVSEENIQRILQTQQKVEGVIAKMTPASVLQMIRDGVNPLQTTMDELGQYLEQLPQDYQQEAENYARFLYGLEKNHDITPKERESYIGIYRLVRQIEKSDGAVVGALVNTGAELEFANLLSQVRSRKFKGMDVKADDNLGTLDHLIQKGDSISRQIDTAFIAEVKEMLTEVSENEEAAQELRAQELKQLREAASAPAEAVELLNRAQMPVTAYHLVATTALLQDASNPFKALKDKAEELKAEDMHWQAEGSEINASESAQALVPGVQQDEGFAGAYTEMLTDLQGKVEDYTFSAGGPETAVDVKELQLYHKQLTILGKVAEHSADGKEEYMLPVYIGEQLTRVHLTVENHETRKGMVQVHWNGENGEELQMEMRLSGSTLSYSIQGNTNSGVMEIGRIADIFNETAGQRWQVEQNLSSSRSEHSSKNTGSAWLKNRLSAGMSEPELPDTEEAADNEELYQVARMALQAIERSRNEN